MGKNKGIFRLHNSLKNHFYGTTCDIGRLTLVLVSSPSDTISVLTTPPAPPCPLATQRSLYAECSYVAEEEEVRILTIRQDMLYYGSTAETGATLLGSV